MGFKYTAEQQQVIDLHGCNILVSAAAGSGKTAVLTERIVKMISDGAHPVDIDRLLVVTFTNAAAAEMRERINGAIAGRLETDADNEHLQKQATLIHNAQITTIDSFCMFIIRNNFNDIGLDPGFRVADEGELKLLKQDAMAKLLEEKFAEGSQEFLNCVEYFSTGSRDKAIEEHILKLYEFAESNPWPEEWLTARMQDYEVNTLEELEETAFISFGMEQVRLVTEDCLFRMRECIALCEQPDGPYMYGEVLEREAEGLEKLLKAERYQDGFALFNGMAFGRLPSKKDDSVSREKRELIQEVRKEIKDTIGKLCAKYFPTDARTVLDYMKGSLPAVKELIGLTLSFKKSLDEKKREENIIDFGDMEHLALSILVERTGEGEEDWQPTKTALDYQAYFQEILIDEYQDSNMVQELLLASISGEAVREEIHAEKKYNRFMVGDVKQSIYRFRLARPEIFMEKYGDYKVWHEGSAASEDRMRIDLHQNFRSRREVIDCVNYIFTGIMGEQLGGVEYDEDAALYPGAVYPEQEKTWEQNLEKSANAAELLLVRKDTERGGKTEKLQSAGVTQTGEAAQAAGATQTGEAAQANRETQTGEAAQADGATWSDSTRKLSDRQQEAAAVARRIKELIRSFQVTDKETGALRPVRYGDMVILLRTNAGWDEDFKSILKEEGIPSHVASRTGYFAAKEVQTLLQLLRILDNPRQDIPLYGVLKSYFGGFDEEEIALIRALTEDKGKNLYFALKEFGGENEEAGELTEQAKENVGTEPDKQRLREKVQQFLAFLEEYRDKTVYMPIHELLQELIMHTGYLHYVSALTGGEQRRANVQILMEKASAFEQTSYYGLFHFVRYIEQLEKYDVDYGEANILDENADVVRIMSIHKSKGLEFPVCFVCGLSKRFNMQDTSGRMIADVDMGMGVDYVDLSQRLQSKTVRKNMVAEKMRLDNLGEELRVLYVALTRAREKLIMTGVIDKPEKKLAGLMLTAMRRSGDAASDGRIVLRERLPYGELSGAGCYLDFILAALCRHPAFEGLWQECGLETPVIKGQETEAENMLIRLVGGEDFLTEQIREQLTAEGARRQLEGSHPVTDTDHELMTYMSDIFSAQYEHSNLADLYTKTTVSELKKTGQEEEKEFSFKLYEEEIVVPYIPKFMKEEDGLGGAGRGSAFHKVMELFDFGERKGSVGKQIEKMVQSEQLSKEYAQAVNISRIEDFLRTGLAERMAAADGRGQLYREQPFVLGLPASELKEEFPAEELVLIQGIIDVYFEEDGELVVADYKTDRVDTAEELVEKYRKQLDYYAQALERITGKRVKEKIIYSFGLGREIML